MVNVGDTIRIISLMEEPNSSYNGVIGKVTRIETDPWGDKRMEGTWGGIFVYIDKDKYEILC